VIDAVEASAQIVMGSRDEAVDDGKELVEAIGESQVDGKCVSEVSRWNQTTDGKCISEVWR
jgi:hypothetical protein